MHNISTIIKNIIVEMVSEIRWWWNNTVARIETWMKKRDHRSASGWLVQCEPLRQKLNFSRFHKNTEKWLIVGLWVFKGNLLSASYSICKVNDYTKQQNSFSPRCDTQFILTKTPSFWEGAKQLEYLSSIVPRRMKYSTLSNATVKD